ncbi:MAG: nucleotidyltransferase domain-containing protein [Ignavibacteriae bacterium]|nr:nucleotidyltransferase domain-containing protein [Ignavibacteriota bacterium]
MKIISKELLEEITRRLVEEFQPHKIILFGSHAWGTPNDDSDVDICVIVEQSTEAPARRASRAYRCLRGVRVSKDILVKTRSEFDRYFSVPASLERAVAEKGKLLYG